MRGVQQRIIRIVGAFLVDGESIGDAGGRREPGATICDSIFRELGGGLEGLKRETWVLVIPFRVVKCPRYLSRVKIFNIDQT